MSLFITIEGGEGAGKTSLIAALLAKLQQENLAAIATREPGGSSLAEAIRALLLQKEMPFYHPKTELLLFLAARTEHIAATIAPALAQGKIVLCDRFNDSTIAYQGAARGLGVNEVESLCLFACQGTLPSLTFYLDLPPKVGLERACLSRGKSNLDRLECEELSFHEKVREGFLMLASQEPKRFCCIDASQPLQKVVDLAWNTLWNTLLYHLKGEPGVSPLNRQ